MLHVRPCGSKAFVGHSAEEQSVAGEQQVGLELRQLVIPVRVAPAAILDLADSARILHDSIHGQVLRSDDLAHGKPPCLRLRLTDSRLSMPTRKGTTFIVA